MTMVSQVYMDIVHSHSCSNVLDGLNMFDGTDHMSASRPSPYHDLNPSLLLS